MTVIEAQGMDMTEMKAPLGTQPVSVEAAALRSMSGGMSFPATVAEFAGEDVVARVPGRVARILVYPGDKVRAGQLVATLEAPEYEAAMRKAQAMSSAKSAEVVSAEREVEHHRNVLGKAHAVAKGTQVARARAQTDIESAKLELQKALDEVSAKKAETEERRVELRLASQELTREGNLYKKGAISLDELQTAERDLGTAAARVKRSEANARSADQSVEIAKNRVKAAEQMAMEVDAQILSAKAEEAQATEGIAQAHADARAKQFESRAATSDASAAAAFSGYRELRALADGVVAERLVSQGTSVVAGQTIIKLKSFAEVRVQAEVPQSMSGSVRTGMPIQVVADSILRNGTLTSVFPTVDSQTRTFRIEAILPNRDGSFKPGMFARLEVGGSGAHALSVRTVAVHTDDSGKYVWTVQTKPGTGKSDWTCTMHPEVSKEGPGTCPKCGMELTLREKGGSLVAHREIITTGRTNGDYTVVASGLSEGENVVWAGFENLIEGTPVMAGGKDSLPKKPGKESMAGTNMQSREPGK